MAIANHDLLSPDGKERCSITISEKSVEDEETDPDPGQSPFQSRNNRLWYRLVRFGFHLLYNELAFIYDPVSWVVSLGNWREWQRAAHPFITGPRVLELAHGPGHMLLELEQAGYQVIGLDLSRNMGRMATKRVIRRRSEVSLVRGEAQALPFESGIFSTVLSTFPSEFILEIETLTTVHRILRPGGTFIVVMGAQLTGKGALRSLIEWLFVATGQRADSGASSEQNEIWNIASERLSSVGFEFQIDQVSANGSLVTLLICQKS